MIGLSTLVLTTWLQAAAQAAATPDPAIEAVVRRFYETQEREDVAGYLSLWSAQANRPSPDQLKFVFDSGDDRFTDIEITRTIPAGNRMRVRIRAKRERTTNRSGAAPIVRTVDLQAALTLEKEGGDWKIVREGLAGDDLAAALLEAATPEERDKLLADDPDPVGPQLLAALARAGTVAATQGNYQRSLTIYEQVVALARKTGHKKEEGDGLQNVANALYYLRRFPEALAVYEQRLVLERERADDAGIAQALAGIATMRYALAEYSESLTRYREALALQEKLDDVAGIAASSLSIGNIAYLQGDYPAAIAAYRRSLDLNRTMTHADGEALALEGLGRVYTAQGDYASALGAFDTVLADARLQSHAARLGSASQNRGDVHLRLGNLDTARGSFERARGYFQSLKDLANVGRLFQSLAVTELIAGRYTEAEDLYKQSGATCASAAQPDAECQARATAGLAYAQLVQEKSFDAASSYRKAVAEFTALRAPEEAARTEVGLSEALAGAKDYAGAIEAAIRARQAATALQNDDVLWRALTAEARAVRRLGDGPRALGVARAAVSAIERLQTAALDKPGVSVTADAASGMATYAVLQAEAGDAAGAFATSERLRALEVRFGLATNEREIARGMTAEDREEERKIATELATLLARLTREKGLPRPDLARVAAFEKAIAEGTDLRRNYLTRLYERLPDLRVWRGLGPTRVAADAVEVLAANDVLLSFVLDEEDVLVLALTRAPVEPVEGQAAAAAPAPAPVRAESFVVPMKRRELAARIGVLQQAPLQTDLAAWKKASADLAPLVPAALATTLATAGTVWVVPHDVLWRVPFEALMVGEALLVERSAVAVGGSLDSLLRAKTSSLSASDSLLAAGAPELTDERLARMRQVAPTWTIRSIENARAEMVAAGALYPDGQLTTLAGAAASEQALRGAAASAAALHLAAPFRINAASPLFSSILLSTPGPTAPAVASTVSQDAPPSGSALPVTAPPDATAPAAADQTQARRESSDDGALELREVMNLSLRARVAVLSDGAALSMRDGASSADVLQWGWLAAGVPSLLVSRWSAHPASTERLLTEFHRGLRSGLAPAAALRAAQRLLQASPETAAPYHWAGWIAIGR